MIFKELLSKFRPEVDIAIAELFNFARTNQRHPQDILLVDINGFKLDKPLVVGKEKYSEFVFGSGGWVHYADETQYMFYDWYRRQECEENIDGFFADLSINEPKQTFCNIHIQIQFMIYLKFWESNVLLTKLYQLSNLARGNPYHWEFKINKDESRHTLIRKKIRDPIKEICPHFYALVKSIYLSQIRDAAAHSDLYILAAAETIGFDNHGPKDFASLSHITFVEWEERFHKLVLLYNALIGNFIGLKEEFIEKQKGKEFGIPIKMTYPNGDNKIHWLKYISIPGSRTDWMWYNTYNKHFKYQYGFAKRFYIG